ncbi:MAG: PDC sensor domain-containing protein, partial [Deferrisomatales bacterium]
MTQPSRRGLGLRGRLTLLVLAALAPVVGLVVADALGHRELGRDEARERSLLLARTVRLEADRLAGDAGRLLESLAEAPGLLLGDPDLCEGLLAEAVAGYPHTEVLVVEPGGAVRCGSRRGLRGAQLGDRAYLRRAIAAGEPADGGYVRARTDGRGRNALARPVTGPGGRVEAVLVAGVGLGWLGELASRGLVPPGAVVAVLDGQGAPLDEYPRDPGGVTPNPAAPRVRAL